MNSVENIHPGEAINQQETYSDSSSISDSDNELPETVSEHTISSVSEEIPQEVNDTFERPESSSTPSSENQDTKPIAELSGSTVEIIGSAQDDSEPLAENPEDKEIAIISDTNSEAESETPSHQGDETVSSEFIEDRDAEPTRLENNETIIEQSHETVQEPQEIDPVSSQPEPAQEKKLESDTTTVETIDSVDPHSPPPTEYPEAEDSSLLSESTSAAELEAPLQQEDETASTEFIEATDTESTSPENSETAIEQADEIEQKAQEIDPVSSQTEPAQKTTPESGTTAETNGSVDSHSAPATEYPEAEDSSLASESKPEAESETSLHQENEPASAEYIKATAVESNNPENSHTTIEQPDETLLEVQEINPVSSPPEQTVKPSQTGDLESDSDTQSNPDENQEAEEVAIMSETQSDLDSDKTLSDNSETTVVDSQEDKSNGNNNITDDLTQTSDSSIDKAAEHSKNTSPTPESVTQP